MSAAASLPPDPPDPPDNTAPASKGSVRIYTASIVDRATGKYVEGVVYRCARCKAAAKFVVAERNCREAVRFYEEHVQCMRAV
jgi:hypothetical protein